MLTCNESIKAFQRKLQIWKRKTIERKLEVFPLVSNTCINETLPIIVEHLISLEEKLSFFFHHLTLNNTIGLETHSWKLQVILV